MSLRARLAIALAALAALAAVAVAFTGYRATESRLRAELDDSLTTTAARVAGNGPAAHAVCESIADRPGRGLDVGDGPNSRRDRDGDDRPGPPLRPGPFGGFADVAVQCLDPSGTVLVTSAPEPLPVEGAERAVLAARSGMTPVRTVSADERRYRIVAVGAPDTVVGAVQFARSTAENERVLRGLRWRYLWLTAGITLLAGLIGWLIARATARPLLELTTTAETVATSNRLDIDVPVGGAGETGRLGRAFATMLAALRQSREQQQRLVQDAGHELRTPLTSLRANVDALARYPDLDPAERARILADLDSELRELTTLADELVTLAIDPDDDEPAGPVDLAALAQDCAERARRRSGRAIDTDLRACTVTGRARQLSRAIDNLLDNALKFSPGDAPVSLTVDAGRVRVADGGPGIDPADLPHVFERFYRSPQARSAPGSGLGLSIVADVAARHGGRALADNGPDGGAVFTIELPTTPA